MCTDTLKGCRPLKASTGKPQGYVALLKQPDDPWRFVNVTLNGRRPQGVAELLMVQQALVGGYIEGIGRPTPRVPYRLVCNEDGQSLSLPRCVDLRGNLSLVGPVLLVRYEYGDDGWDDVSMSLDKGTAVHVKALRQVLDVHLHSNDIVSDRYRTVDVIPLFGAKEAVHA